MFNQLAKLGRFLRSLNLQEAAALSSIVIGGWVLFTALSSLYTHWRATPFEISGSSLILQRDEVQRTLTAMEREFESVKQRHLTEINSLIDDKNERLALIDRSEKELLDSLGRCKQKLDLIGIQLAAEAARRIDPGPQPLFFDYKFRVNAFDRWVALPVWAHPIDYFTWEDKKKAYDAACVLVEHLERERDLAQSEHEQQRERLSLEAFDSKRASISTNCNMQQASLKKEFEEQSSIHILSQARLHARLHAIQKTLDESTLWQQLKHYLRAAWNKVISPLLHIGLAVASLAFVVRMAFRFVLMRRWMGMGRI